MNIYDCTNTDVVCSISKTRGGFMNVFFKGTQCAQHKNMWRSETDGFEQSSLYIARVNCTLPLRPQVLWSFPGREAFLLTILFFFFFLKKSQLTNAVMRHLSPIEMCYAYAVKNIKISRKWRGYSTELLICIILTIKNLRDNGHNACMCVWEREILEGSILFLQLQVLNL